MVTNRLEKCSWSKKARETKDAMDGLHGKWAKMSFEILLVETDGDGVDLSMKRPTLGMRTVKDKAI